MLPISEVIKGLKSMRDYAQCTGNYIEKKILNNAIVYLEKALKEKCLEEIKND